MQITFEVTDIHIKGVDDYNRMHPDNQLTLERICLDKLDQHAAMQKEANRMALNAKEDQLETASVDPVALSEAQALKAEYVAKVEALLKPKPEGALNAQGLLDAPAADPTRLQRVLDWVNATFGTNFGG